MYKRQSRNQSEKILTRGIHKKVGWMEDEDRLLWRLRRLDRKREVGGRHRRKRANGRTASKQRGVSPRASLRPQLQCDQMWFHCKKILQIHATIKNI